MSSSRHRSAPCTPSSPARSIPIRVGSLRRRLRRPQRRRAPGPRVCPMGQRPPGSPARDLCARCLGSRRRDASRSPRPPRPVPPLLLRRPGQDRLLELDRRADATTGRLERRQPAVARRPPSPSLAPYVRDVLRERETRARRARTRVTARATSRLALLGSPAAGHEDRLGAGGGARPLRRTPRAGGRALSRSPADGDLLERRARLGLDRRGRCRLGPCRRRCRSVGALTGLPGPGRQRRARTARRRRDARDPADHAGVGLGRRLGRGHRACCRAELLAGRAVAQLLDAGLRRARAVRPRTRLRGDPHGRRRRRMARRDALLRSRPAAVGLHSGPPAALRGTTPLVSGDTTRIRAERACGDTARGPCSAAP